MLTYTHIHRKTAETTKCTFFAALHQCSSLKVENVSQLSNLPARLKKNTFKLRKLHKSVSYKAKRSCTADRTQAPGKTLKAEQTPSYAHKTANCKTHRVAPLQDNAQFSNFYIKSHNSRQQAQQQRPESTILRHNTDSRAMEPERHKTWYSMVFPAGKMLNFQLEARTLFHQNIVFVKVPV